MARVRDCVVWLWRRARMVVGRALLLLVVAIRKAAVFMS